MQDILILLGAAVALAVVIAILVYNRFDRLSFLIERQLKHCESYLDDWARCCGELQPGSDAAYFKARKPRQKVACMRQMIDEVKLNSEEKLDLQEQLLEFCSIYNEFAERHDTALASPIVGRIGRWIGCKPWGKLDFYPDIQVGRKP